jgi:RimJ/RimL family protein N-acetyltransferase
MSETPSAWTGKLVRLRSPEPDDAKAFNADSLDTEGQRMGYEVTFPRSLERTRQWATDEALSDGAGRFTYRWAIELVQGGQLVGSMNTHDADARNGNFQYGIAIFRDQRGKGYASEAISLVMRYYFQELRFNKANATVFGFNEPSLALHRKLGFTEEGRIRQNIFTNGVYHDEHWFGMTAAEFRERNG